MTGDTGITYRPRSLGFNPQTSLLQIPICGYLQQTWWVEVEGELEFTFPPGTYTVFFRLQLGRRLRQFGRRVCNTEQVPGWDIKPVQF
ncbi:hypothetical protein SAY86_020579 [Trapa natans]|nr:hypothetical protein SAY86_020579 [Trapa natans]